MYGRKVEDFITNIQETGTSFYSRSNIFGTEIIWGDTKYFFPSKDSGKGLKQSYIFGMVKKDAIKYLKKKNGKIRLTKWKPTVWWNEKLKEDNSRQIVGVDIDGAYWKIAHNMGVISDSTYQHGNLLDMKNIRLAALATLGSDKSYSFYKKSGQTNETMIICGDDELKKLYKVIRYKCYQYMHDLAIILNHDFVCYKTDCIYFYSSASNIKKVKKFLDTKKLDFKLLKEMPSIVEEKYS